MSKGYKQIVMLRGMKLMHVAIMIALFVGVWSLYYVDALHIKLISSSTALIWGTYSILTVLLDRTYNALDVGMSRVQEIIYSQSLTNLICAGIAYALFSASWLRLTNPLPLLLMVLLQILVNIVWSLAANKLYFALNAPRRTVIIYRRKSDLHKLEEIKYLNQKFDICKHIENPKDDIHALIQEIEGYEVVFVAGIHATLRNGIAKYCIDRGIEGYITPHVGDIIMAGAKHMRMFSVPIMQVQRVELSPEYALVKRLFDVVCSLIALIVLSPVMLVIALAIKLYDRGPVLYRQTRLTKNGEHFEILKFRSMRTDAEKDGVPRLATEADDRVTPIGKLIRAIRLDELPQLINILRGDMSIVGPRPERPEIAAEYEKKLPAFSMRLQVKAGLTGLAQVYGRYNSEPYAKLQMDLMYINHMSFIEDLKLMFATVKILFMKESTEGFEAGEGAVGLEQRERKKGQESA